ncbi:MAG: hypothetical protein IPM82_13565 [Saprospiraceae bacterium]|nr:hypothetical protein [Saprospiraceae bacterium]
MKNKLGFTIILLLSAAIGFGQNRVMDIGLEVQVYPTGYIPGFRVEKSFTKRDLGSVRVGYQIIDHRDQGLHDDETGSGFGGSLGYKHYFNRYFTGPSLGLRTDVWANKIDWVTKLEMGGESKGSSDILVVQPTVEFGWAFTLGENLVLTPAAAFGFEINVKTTGEDTGEGAILLAGLTAAYRIQ